MGGDINMSHRAIFHGDRSNFVEVRRMAIYRLFQYGGRPPSWICYTRVWTNHEGRLYPCAKLG